MSRYHKPPSPQQRAFDRKYITAAEVCALAGIAASTLMIARREGRMPFAIKCAGTYLWERTRIQPYLDRLLQRPKRMQPAQPGIGWNHSTNTPIIP